MEVSTYQIWSASLDPKTFQPTGDPPQPTGATRVDIFDKNAAGDVVHKWYDGKTWSGWENLGQSS